MIQTAAINPRVYDSRDHKSAHVIADCVLLPPATRKLDRNVHQVRPDAPISPDNNNIGPRGSVAVTRTQCRRVGATAGVGTLGSWRASPLRRRSRWFL